MLCTLALHCTVCCEYAVCACIVQHFTGPQHALALCILFVLALIMLMESTLTLVSDRPLVSRRLSTWPPLCPADLDSILQMALARAWQRGRGTLAPVACVQAVQAARLPYSQGIQQEQKLMSMLFASPQARALQYCFFSQRAVSKWSMPNGACWDNSTARPIRKVAVIGRTYLHLYGWNS